MARQATAEKRQRRERGSINPDDIIKGAFELAEQVGIDNLCMPLLGKHLGVGVTSIYWYFRKKDDLLNAMTDRALRQYVFATPVRRSQGLARDVAKSRAHDAKDVHGQPDSVRPDSYSVRAQPAGGAAGCPGGGEGDRQPGRGGAVAGGRLRHLFRGVGPRPRIGGAAAAPGEEPGGRRGAERHRGNDDDRSGKHPAARVGDGEGSSHRGGRREELRVRPRVHPRPRGPVDRRRRQAGEGRAQAAKSTASRSRSKAAAR